ncbi:MAG: hypothetical protein FWE16_04780 [Firmicutes bacterium]|nr:hypothetical protein [Bacillota bacterium]
MNFQGKKLTDITPADIAEYRANKSSRPKLQRMRFPDVDLMDILIAGAKKDNTPLTTCVQPDLEVPK